MRRSAIIRWRSSVMRSSVVKGTGSEEPQEPAPHDGAGEYPLRAITDSDRPYWKELRPTTLPRSGLVQQVFDCKGRNHWPALCCEISQPIPGQPSPSQSGTPSNVFSSTRLGQPPAAEIGGELRALFRQHCDARRIKHREAALPNSVRQIGRASCRE